MANEFTRTLSERLINDLKNAQLFDLLKKDIKAGKVFPAIRNNTIQFYYNGCLLFKYTQKGFETHYKYLMNNALSNSDKYVRNDGTAPIDPSDFIIRDFISGYESIKQSINTYAKPEALLTSGFYDKSFLKEGVKGDYLLIDIEAAFEKQPKVVADCDTQLADIQNGKRKGTDRIDAVFYDVKQHRIVFCEVKRFDDDRIVPKDGNIEVLDQLQRYEDQIAKRRDEIIQAYNNSFKVYEKLFKESNSAKPFDFTVEDIYYQAILFVTGYPRLLYGESDAKKDVEKIIDDNGFKVHFADRASGTALNDICKMCK